MNAVAAQAIVLRCKRITSVDTRLMLTIDNMERCKHYSSGSS
jgi:hypothetical protein